MTVSIGSVQLSGIGEDQISWVDQYDWQPVGQSLRHSLSGDLHITENARSGRSITLSASLPWAWILKDTLEALHALVATPGEVHTLTFGAESFQVIFDRSQSPLQFEPVNPLRQQFTGVIRLIEV